MKIRKLIFGLVLLATFANADEKEKLKQAIQAHDSGEYTLAVSNFTAAISINREQMFFLYDCRGDSHFKLGQYKKALQDYQYALRGSSTGNIEFKIGRTHGKLKNYDHAISFFDKTIKLSKEGGLQEALALYYKGRMLSRQEKFKEAREVFIEIKSNNESQCITEDIRLMIEFCTKQIQKNKDRKGQSRNRVVERKPTTNPPPRNTEGSRGSGEGNS